MIKIIKRYDDKIKGFNRFYDLEEARLKHESKMECDE